MATSNLLERVYAHKNNIIEGFTSKYKCHDLVYYAVFDSISLAIAEEKRIKDGSRKKKIALIEAMNPHWLDLYADITQ